MISYLKLKLGPDWHGISKNLVPFSKLPNLCHLVLCFECPYMYHTQTERLVFLDMIQGRCKAGLLKTIEVQFRSVNSTSRDIEADIRAVIGDNVEMRVEGWSPLELDYRYSFSGPELPEFW